MIELDTLSEHFEDLVKYTSYKMGLISVVFVKEP